MHDCVVHYVTVSVNSLFEWQVQVQHGTVCTCIYLVWWLHGLSWRKWRVTWL